MTEPAKNETQPKDTHGDLAPRPHPWLLISDSKHEERQTLFNILENYYYTHTIPKMRNKTIYPCAHGWMALIDENTECYLWNPVSLEKVQLPPLEGLNLEVCLLSSPPSDAACHILFVNFVDHSFLVCKPGDHEFQQHEFVSGDGSGLGATTVVGKTIYCLTWNCTLFSIEFLGSSLKFRKQITVELPGREPAPPEFTFCNDFLAECQGELYFVRKMTFGSFNMEVYGFVVMRMDSSKRRWVRITSIGERTMFVSPNHGMYCVATESGIRPNSIYFTSHFSRYLYIYDLEYLSITRSLPCPTVRRKSMLQWIMM